MKNGDGKELHCDEVRITDAELMQKVAKRIKLFRESKNISQAVFYYETKMHIGRIETGSQNLTLSTINSICNCLGVKVSDLFAGL
jgi:transcriptional regulator with XRE-family HTH domain